MIFEGMQELCQIGTGALSDGSVVLTGPLPSITTSHLGASIQIEVAADAAIGATVLQLRDANGLRLTGALPDGAGITADGQPLVVAGSHSFNGVSFSINLATPAVALISEFSPVTFQAPILNLASSVTAGLHNAPADITSLDNVFAFQIAKLDMVLQVEAEWTAVRTLTDGQEQRGVVRKVKDLGTQVVLYCQV